jgi:hypothetical protein
MNGRASFHSFHPIFDEFAGKVDNGFDNFPPEKRQRCGVVGLHVPRSGWRNGLFELISSFILCFEETGSEGGMRFAIQSDCRCGPSLPSPPQRQLTQRQLRICGLCLS